MFVLRYPQVAPLHIRFEKVVSILSKKIQAATTLAKPPQLTRLQGRFPLIPPWNMSHALIWRAFLFHPSRLVAAVLTVRSAQVAPTVGWGDGKYSFSLDQSLSLSLSLSQGGDSATPNPGQEGRMATNRKENPMPCPAHDDQMNYIKGNQHTLPCPRRNAPTDPRCSSCRDGQVMRGPQDRPRSPSLTLRCGQLHTGEIRAPGSSQTTGPSLRACFHTAEAWGSPSLGPRR
jgi:hypothetical protein